MAKTPKDKIRDIINRHKYIAKLNYNIDLDINIYSSYDGVLNNFPSFYDKSGNIHYNKPIMLEINSQFRQDIVKNISGITYDKFIGLLEEILRE